MKSPEVKTESKLMQEKFRQTEKAIRILAISTIFNSIGIISVCFSFILKKG